jgi:hypothetical protein
MPDQERLHVNDQVKDGTSRAPRNCYVDPDEDLLPIDWLDGRPNSQQLMEEVLLDLGFHPA